MYDNTCGRFKGISRKILLAILAAGMTAFGASGIAAEEIEAPETETPIANTIDTYGGEIVYTGVQSVSVEGSLAGEVIGAATEGAAPEFALAFDGDTDTYVSLPTNIGSAVDNWLGIKFPAPVTPTKIALAIGAANQHAKIFGSYIQGSNDGITWETIELFDDWRDYASPDQGGNWPADAVYKEVEVDANEYTYFRYFNYNDMGANRLNEFLIIVETEAPETDAPETEAPETETPIANNIDTYGGEIIYTGVQSVSVDGSLAGEVIGAGDEFYAEEIVKAFDGDLDTIAELPQNTGTNVSYWMGIKFDTPVNPAKFALAVYPHHGIWYSYIQGSNDGITWETIKFFNDWREYCTPEEGGDWPESYPYKEVDDTSSEAYTYFRYFNNGGSGYNRLSEFLIYEYVDAPETDAPETDAPETDAPETDAPETDAPETDAPETDAPETDAPETEPVEPERTVTAEGTCGDNLTWVLYDDGELVIDGTGAMWSRFDSNGLLWDSNINSIQTVTVCNGVTSIGERAFVGYTDLVSVTIGDSVTTIEDYAFAYCTALTSVTIGNSVTTIKDGAFTECTGLTNVTIPDSVTTIEDNVFERTGLTSIIIPNSVTTIGVSAFHHCDNLTSVIISDSVETIWDWTFAYCGSLTSVTIPDGVATIREYAFAHCSGMKSVTVLCKTTEFGGNVFAHSDDAITLYGYAGSTAESYANSYMYNFVMLEAPETEAPETEAPETEAPETEAPMANTIDTYSGEIIYTGIMSTSVDGSLEGEVIGTGSSADELVKAFDGNMDTQMNLPSNIGSFVENWVGIKFPAPVNPTTFALAISPVERRCYIFGSYIQGSNDGINWETIKTFGDWREYATPEEGGNWSADAVYKEVEVDTNEYSYFRYFNYNDMGMNRMNEFHVFGDMEGEPETEVPETDAPETDAPETEAPETEVPETDAPETDAPETEAPETDAPETDDPETDAPETDAPVTFTLSSTNARPGETVAVELSLENTNLINSVALYNLTYDTERLTFAGFADYDAMEEKCSFGESFDETQGIITLALAEDEVLSGFLCTLLFEVKEDAAEGDAEISMTSLVKMDYTKIPSEVTAGRITVKHQLIGDINNDDVVDIRDARALFKYSMLPEFYPVDYPFSMDFNGDGYLDINDARLLFRYSMLPDIYPIA